MSAEFLSAAALEEATGRAGAGVLAWVDDDHGDARCREHVPTAWWDRLCKWARGRGDGGFYGENGYAGGWRYCSVCVDLGEGDGYAWDWSGVYPHVPECVCPECDGRDYFDV